MIGGAAGRGVGAVALAAVGLAACGGYHKHGRADAGKTDAAPPDGGCGVEVCNGRDDDCDGVVDDGVVSACGECIPGCEAVVFGHEEGETPFDPEPESFCGTRDPGDLVLSDDGWPRFAVWIPNTETGTVSRVDAFEHREIGRYRTGNAPLMDRPSRTGVDALGIVVANQAALGAASATRILDHACPDVDRNGAIDTSTGRTDVRDFGEDECVGWHTDLGPLALANAVVARTEFGADGVVALRTWVGLQNESRYVELDGETGEPTGAEIDTAPCAPTGAVADEEDDVFWSACDSARIARVDTLGGTVEIVDAPDTPTGIAVDASGRVWIGSLVVSFWDPGGGAWERLGGVAGFRVAASFLADGAVWIGGECYSGANGPGTCRADEDLAVTYFEAPSFGVIPYAAGEVWGVRGDGAVSAIELGSKEVRTYFDDCEDGPCFDGPDAYSDLVAPVPNTSHYRQCAWSRVVEGCAEGGTRWARLGWEADLPEGATISFQVRTADTREVLEAASFVAAAQAPDDASPIDLTKVLGESANAAFLEVELVLLARRFESQPTLHRLEVDYECAAP